MKKELQCHFNTSSQNHWSLLENGPIHWFEIRIILLAIHELKMPVIHWIEVPQSCSHICAEHEVGATISISLLGHLFYLRCFREISGLGIKLLLNPLDIPTPGKRSLIFKSTLQNCLCGKRVLKKKKKKIVFSILSEVELLR